MKGQQLYRKNLYLIFIFIILISISLIVALGLAYNLTKKYVENEFYSQKIDVLEKTVRPYNDFFQNKIPEISFYQGYLDSTSALKYVDTVFTNYPFLKRVIFYDTEISNHAVNVGFRSTNFHIGPKAVYQFGKNVNGDLTVVFKKNISNRLSLKTADEFNKMAAKLTGFIETADTTKTINADDLSIFYSVNPNRISYMNVPRNEEIKTFKDLMFKNLPKSVIYQQDIFTFYLSPFGLKINNSQPELYQHISIKPLIYESLANEPNIIHTDMPLPGAFTDFKLYFSSSKHYLNKEINKRFLPIGGILFLVYGFLLLIALLIYRNLNINSKMFKLQYDFVTNLTHEFKTPVSVIKIAGNNILSAKSLSEKERSRYGKILDEEADKLNNLMNLLLSFTQIENRAITLNEEVIELGSFCQDITNSYHIKYPNLIIKWQLQSLKKIKADRILLSSIFTNLIDNAYKYSNADKPKIAIVAERVKGRITLRFIDNGIGIEQNELANIFKKFYRIQSQYNQQGSVGLGLAFCKELVNFMNGTISVKSIVGKGSEFIINLPYES